jgi:hypothetical protein
MTDIPIGVGDAAAQRRYIEAHNAFLKEYSALRVVLEKVSLRTLQPPKNEFDRVRDLPEDALAAVTVMDKWLADITVFGLGRIIADDFSEVLTLAGNAYGIGALKIVRGMYERLVTAAYVAKKPSEARPFIKDDAIKRWKLWQQALSVLPDLKDKVPKEKLDELEAEYNRVRATRKDSICNKCGQPKTQEAWTRVDLATMAKEADPNLAALYGACYLIPTFHSHATGFNLIDRFHRTESGNSYQEMSEKEARQATMLAHNLLIRHLTLQNEYFNLGMDAEIQPRIDAFVPIWRARDWPGNATEV